jgi:DNA helicase HerA-like ATPase
VWAEGTELLARRRGALRHPVKGVVGDGGVFKVVDEDVLIEDVRSAASADELMHMFIAGASAAGKTTLVKSIISRQRYVVIDITPKGEYATSLGPTVEGSIDFSSFSVEERVQLLTLAFAATLGKEDASFSPVQFGALRRFGAVPLENLLTAIAGAPDLPQLSKQVMIEKLASLCASVDTEYNCTPHPLLTKQVEVKPPVVVRVAVEDPFLQAVIVHGILMRLLKIPQQEPTFVVIDEYHRVSAKVENIEDPVERVIRMGRHGNWHMIISTQSPLELKVAVLSIIPTHAYFQLHGEAAKMAGEVLNVDPAVISSLGPGQWLAVVRSGPGRPAWHRRSP